MKINSSRYKIHLCICLYNVSFNTKYAKRSNYKLLCKRYDSRRDEEASQNHDGALIKISTDTESGRRKSINCVVNASTRFATSERVYLGEIRVPWPSCCSTSAIY